MNLPNKLTLFRILMIPIFVATFYVPFLKNNAVTLFNLDIPWSYLVGMILFSIAAFTDFLDGNIARKQNIVTTFGKFMDPLADKLLVMSALLVAVEFIDFFPSYVVIIILAREFMVTGIRLLAVGEGKVIAASQLGKAKTVSQMVMIISLFLLPKGFIVYSLVVIATLLTVISGLDYFIKNRTIVFESK